MRKIIAIHGAMHSGKSTIAAHLKKELRAVVKPFAQPIKEFATLLGWDGVKDAKGRRLLQLLGTEVGRECIHADIWVNKWEDGLEDTGANVTVICDDLRFQNEYEYLCSLDVEVVLFHVIRPSEAKGLFSRFKRVHQSERGIQFTGSLRPIEIHNTGTISQLLERVDNGLL